MIKVKICGLTNREDALKAFDLGADLLGFVFIKGTPRYRDDLKDTVKDVMVSAKDTVPVVGLFRNEDRETVIDTVSYCGIDHIQFQGDEDPDYCAALKEGFQAVSGRFLTIIKAIKVQAEKDELYRTPYGYDDYGDSVDYFVFDTYHPELPGGVGIKFNEEVIVGEKDKINKPFFMAGGLDPGNVADVIKTVRPYGVDVSSGVEKETGKKDGNLLKEFIQNAKNA